MREGCVYLIRKGETDIYKVGYTASDKVDSRIRQLQTGCEEKLSCVGFYCSQFASYIERTLHRQYGLTRMSGEWFRIDGDAAAKFGEDCAKVEKTAVFLSKNNTFFQKKNKIDG